MKRTMQRFTDIRDMMSCWSIITIISFYWRGILELGIRQSYLNLNSDDDNNIQIFKHG